MAFEISLAAFPEEVEIAIDLEIKNNPGLDRANTIDVFGTLIAFLITRFPMWLSAGEPM